MNTENNPNDFRLLLQQEFVKRCRKNENYSLRAFARSLKIQPSPLSALLRGKRPITDKTKERLGRALGLDPVKIRELHSSSEKLESFQQLTLDNYALISDWYHYAILELIRTKSFKPDVAYVAKTLGLTQTETQIATERLQRLGLLSIHKSGKWVDNSSNGLATNISPEFTSVASKKLQREILEMSIKALASVDLARRDHTSMTMAIHPEDLPEARKRLKKFRRELCAFFEKNKSPSEVYQLSLSLFPITNAEK